MEFYFEKTKSSHGRKEEEAYFSMESVVNSMIVATTINLWPGFNNIKNTSSIFIKLRPNDPEENMLLILLISEKSNNNKRDTNKPN